MTGSTTGEESFIAKNMDANIHAPSAGGVGTPNGHYFGGIAEGQRMGGEIGASLKSSSLDQSFGSAKEGLGTILSGISGDALGANPFDAIDKFMPIQNIGAVGQAIQQTGKGLSGVAELKSFGGAINACIAGHTSFASPSKGGGMQAG